MATVEGSLIISYCRMAAKAICRQYHQANEDDGSQSLNKFNIAEGIADIRTKLLEMKSKHTQKAAAIRGISFVRSVIHTVLVDPCVTIRNS
jgi:hypothetical protein